MKDLRKLHLYIGCIFAPALVFFIVTGCWQTFRLNDASKDGTYKPPAVVEMLSEVHIHAKYAVGRGQGHSSQPFKIFVAAMAFFLLITIGLGIALALRSARQSWKVWACLLAGILLPFLLLRLG